MPLQRKSGIFTSGNASPLQTSLVSGSKNYIEQQSGSWRHEFSSAVPEQGTPSALLPDEYILTDLVRFRRTYSGTADVSPTPSSGNNYRFPTAFNGSYVDNFDCTVRIKNNGTLPATLDVYLIALSFFDAYIWNGIQPSNCPVQFNTVSPNDGTVTVKTMTASICDRAVVENTKFAQHYWNPIGSITVGNSDNASSVAEVKITEIPPKCRRMQTGQYFGLILHNNSDSNFGATLNLDYFKEEKFLEHPSSNRLPYVV